MKVKPGTLQEAIRLEIKRNYKEKKYSCERVTKFFLGFLKKNGSAEVELYLKDKRKTVNISSFEKFECIVYRTLAKDACSLYSKMQDDKSCYLKNGKIVIDDYVRDEFEDDDEKELPNIFDIYM